MTYCLPPWMKKKLLKMESTLKGNNFVASIRANSFYSWLATIVKVSQMKMAELLPLKMYSFTSKCLNQYMLSEVQSTLAIPTSVISNNRLSQRENLVRVVTQKSKIR